MLIVTRPPMERRLNWIPDPVPILPRNNGKENHPPPAEPRKLPRKMRLCRKRKEHHHHLAATGSAPGISQPPRCVMSASVKDSQPPQLPQHPQPPHPAANHNSAQPDLLSQAELGRLYKPACPSISKDTTTRSRRDNFPGSNLSFNCSQRSHREYFSGSPCRALNPTQTPPRAALPDVALDVEAQTPESAATAHIPRADRPPVVLEIPRSHPEPSEPRRCPETPGKWFRPLA